MLGTGYQGCQVVDLAQGLLADSQSESLVEMDMGQLGRMKGLGKAKRGF